MITLSMLFVFVAYIVFITIRYGVLPSVSESYYRLPYKQKYLFWVFLTYLGLGMLLQGGVWFSISGAGFWLVGVMEPFKHEWKFVGTLHVIGAYTLIIAALLGLGFDRGDWASIFGFFVVLGIIRLIKPSNETFWIEMNAFFWIMSGLLMYPKI